ncbi:hypothetical protein FB451DRAFT_1179549 [Mycena latifolia]|nr:hypothetical protein FB451DRAFT_1179549 [Mycena latifolia]
MKNLNAWNRQPWVTPAVSQACSDVQPEGSTRDRSGSTRDHRLLTINSRADDRLTATRVKSTIDVVSLTALGRLEGQFRYSYIHSSAFMGTIQFRETKRCSDGPVQMARQMYIENQSTKITLLNIKSRAKWDVALCLTLDWNCLLSDRNTDCQGTSFPPKLVTEPFILLRSLSEPQCNAMDVYHAHLLSTTLLHGTWRTASPAISIKRSIAALDIFDIDLQTEVGLDCPEYCGVNCKFHLQNSTGLLSNLAF